MPRHEGIRERADGYWEFRLRVDGRRRSFYAHTYDEALALKAEKLNDKRQGLPVAAKGTVADFLGRWLETSVRPSVDPATFDQYSQHVRLYLAPRDANGKCLALPHLGAIKLANLRPDHVRAWIADMLTHLAPRTTQLALTVFRHGLDSAVADGIIARNVAKLAKRPKAERPEVRVFLPDEAKDFLAAISGKRLEALYLITLRLGLRESEVIGLRWRDINFDLNTLTINQTVKRIGRGTGASKLVFGDTKTPNSRRSPSLSTSMVTALKAHRARQAEERLATGATGVITTSSSVRASERRSRRRIYAANSKPSSPKPNCHGSSFTHSDIAAPRSSSMKAYHCE
jgi:integrase